MSILVSIGSWVIPMSKLVLGLIFLNSAHVLPLLPLINAKRITGIYFQLR